MAVRILFADDEEKMRNLVRMFLEKEGYQVEVTTDGNQAVRRAAEGKFNLIILDVMMPGQDGLSVCREIRKFSSVPIIMLTARGDEIDRVLGFELGADDYVVKPFSPRELVARVKALLRRAGTYSNDESKEVLIEFDGLSIDVGARKIMSGDHEITLTPKEFDLLLFLAENPSKVFTRENILARVWGYDYFGDLRTVDTHIKKLREKLSQSGNKFVHTVWGVGYKFEVSRE
ncbi:response regulator transcription factor [Metallumcola ferriviriculae]|uniref:Stage 0 sporulation protein A homolog n=1 Tax=Metallumcola ferriviriculae TaxID=3039180 RepID=A0AAU0ULI4_9FIRM|nr:response regulator transcription factor [Desulfitibacteraceae bacterium MK1]